MALNLPVFYQRTGSAIVFAAVMLVGLLWNQTAFYVLVLLINALCLREYFRLMKKIDSDAYWPRWIEITIQLMSALLLICSCPYGLGYLSETQKEIIISLECLILIIPAIAIILSVLPAKNSFKALLQAMAGIFYITIPMYFLFLMQRWDHSLPIALILLIWTNDTMAYLVGSFIGKTPFSPISPKKTWEGTGGGALLTMIGAMIYGYFSHKFRLVDWAVLALCAGIAGTLGDLVESKLKRIADVKDSGTMMPGHGGALDRFDSLLLAAPFAGTYVLLFMMHGQ